jgi:DNA-binding response OmpR family regulator
MVLTGRAEMEERVRCLELGADDVVLKPFSFQELRARLKAMGRRRSRSQEAVMRFGDVEMDRAEHRVVQAGREVELTATEFSLLESLLRRRGERVCSRSELLNEVWHSPAEMGTNIVEVYINYLRRKLGQTGLHPGTLGTRPECLIRTVRGQGYILSRCASMHPASGINSAQVLEHAAG